MPKPVAGLELVRLSALYKYGVLDAAPEPAFDTILAKLAQTIGTPVATITAVDATRLRVVAAFGAVERELPRHGSPCDALVDGVATLVIPDTQNPKVAELCTPVICPPSVRAYAGVRLRSPDDDAIGVVSVAAHEPRDFDAADLAALEQASRDVTALLESLRRARSDAATGALTRGAFVEQIHDMARVLASGGQNLSLVVMDVDPQRMRIDGRQPAIGKLLLRRMADLGRDQVRRRDSFGRLGRHRFGVLLADTDEKGARILAHRLAEKAVDGWEGLPAQGHAAPVAMGIVSFRPPFGDAESIVAQAERACAMSQPAMTSDGIVPLVA